MRVVSAALDGISSAPMRDSVDHQFKTDLTRVAWLAQRSDKARHARLVQGSKKRADAKLRRF